MGFPPFLKIMEANKLYRTKRVNYQGNTGGNAGLILKGATVNVAVYGSQSRPTALTDMVLITEEAAITAAGAYGFVLLPDFIAITGTVTAIELVNVTVELIGDIS